MTNGSLKQRLIDQPEEFFDTLKFKDLRVGDKYICMPLPGDNSGHGGYKNGSYVFRKIEPVRTDNYGPRDNCVKMLNGTLSHMSDSADVIKVLD